jgi:hypothetical protein
MRGIFTRIIWLIACGATVFTPPAQAEPTANVRFGAYEVRDDVDPFPAAHLVPGWGYLSGPGNQISHHIILELSSSETVEQELERRVAPDPVLPAGVRLLYRVEPSDKVGYRTLTSAVVNAAPVIEAADLAKCTRTAIPLVTFVAGEDNPHRASEPVLRIDLTHAAHKKMDAYLKAGPKERLLLFAFGEESGGSLYAASLKQWPAEIKLAESQLEAADALCAGVHAAHAR